MATGSSDEKQVSGKKAGGKKKAKSGSAQPASKTQLQMVMLRNNFYRDNFKFLMFLCLLLMCFTAGAISYIIYLQKNKPIDRYFATTPDEKLIRMIPLNQPNLVQSALLQWAVEAGTSSYNFNYVEYQETLQEVRKYFTKQGYQNFRKALNDSRTLSSVIETKLVVTAVPTDAPVVLKEGITSTGRYAWQVQFPMKITYQSQSNSVGRDIVITMLITRVPTSESERGIGIASLQVREGKPQ